ncbi:MAG: TIGR03089 family protein [Actinomycetota bacterium]|nr:TIGR03089 family protein [Actinomycetota bacterium]
MTYYDDATGERTELSYATFDNWASKTANLLNEELGVGRGTDVWLTVTDHWTAAVVMVACWKLGAVVHPARNPAARADQVVVVDEAGASATSHPVARLLTLGRGMGGRTGAAVPGLAFGDEVSAFADDYDDPDVTLDDLALVIGGATLRQGELLAAAAATGSLHRDDRLLATRPLESAAAILDGLVAPLVAGASVVWSVATAPDSLERRVDEERVTVLPRPDR